MYNSVHPFSFRMSLYPTLEDMVVDQYETMQRDTDSGRCAMSQYPEPSAPLYESRNVQNPPPIYESIRECGAAKGVCAYPTLPNYFACTAAQAQSAHSAQQSPSANDTLQRSASVASGTSTNHESVVLRTPTMIAPITSQSTGFFRANVTHCVRQAMLAKDRKGKYGMRFRSINKGIFVQFVADGSPAAYAGIRFGDQILKLNDTEVIGMTADKAMDLMTNTKNPQQLLVTFRDRPFERTITLHRDSSGNFGFTHKENLITAIAKDSSASRNGLLIQHRIIEIDGRNVIAFKNKEVKNCLNDAPQTVTLTIMPTELYDELVKRMDWSLMKKQDHSIPEIYSS